MNNKDIQTLIEEASKENHRGSFNPDSVWLQVQSFQEGANFALSLFKWRKVSEELPKMETVLIKVMCHYPNGNHEVKVTTGTILTVDKCNLDNELIEEITRSYKAIEWMPIPQID